MLAMLILCSGCGNIRDIRVASADIESVSLQGMRSVAAAISATVSNPARGMEISEVEGTVYHKGTEIGIFNTDPIDIEGRTDSTYQIHAVLSLSPSVSPLSLLSALSGLDINDFSISVSAKVKMKCGIKKRVSTGRIPLKYLMENFGQDKQNANGFI